MNGSLRWRQLAGALVGLLLLTACQRPARRLEAPPVPHATRQFAGTTLTYYGDSPPPAPQLEQALIERFQADTGIRVTLRLRPLSATETYGVYERLFAAQDASVDVLLLDVIWPGAFAPYLLDLKPSLAREATRHVSMSLQNDTVAGRLVAMPCFLDMGLLYYRTDLLRQYGFSAPPATWEELEHMARTIQAGERKRQSTFWGFVWEGAPQEVLTCNALEWQASHGGGRLVDPAGRIELNNPRAIAAFQRAASWVGTITPPGVTAYEESDALAPFRQGDVAFMRNWAYVYAACSTADSPIRDRFAVAPLPHAAGPYHSASVLGGWQVGVSRFSKHPAAAIELVRYLTSPEVQTWRAVQASYIPTMPSVLAQPEVRAAQPYLRALDVRMENLVARPSAMLKASYPAVSQAYFEGVSEILQGEPAEATVQGMQRDIELLRRRESSVRTPSR
ncbi:MAG TPA: ABC transporter substrate-binding protein [Stenomitos sp.]